MTTGFTVCDLVILERDRGLDPAPPKMLPNRPGGISLVRHHPVWSRSRSTPSGPVDLNPVEHLGQLRGIPGLSCGDRK